jgi:hypothetical protein
MRAMHKAIFKKLLSIIQLNKVLLDDFLLLLVGAQHMMIVMIVM